MNNHKTAMKQNKELNANMKPEQTKTTSWTKVGTAKDVSCQKQLSWDVVSWCD